MTWTDTPPEMVSTSLAHIAHMMMLASHYLAIRLPAELTLPHRDYPRPTVFSLSSSYSHGTVPFPGSTNIQSPVHIERRGELRAPRPRPLFIDKPLPLLAKEDPQAYIMFIEGVSLLAYDIAWACSSQGIPIGEKSSFDYVCNVGRNLYNLLIGNQLHSNPAERIFTTGPSTATNQTGGELPEPAKTTTMMGRYSHGTAHTFLGDDFVSTFGLPTPNMLTDRLKSKLSSAAVMPEWEVLNDSAWTPDDHMEDGVLPKSHQRRESDRRLFGVESMATVRGALSETQPDINPPRSSERAPEKPKGSGISGWTKLKPR